MLSKLRYAGVLALDGFLYTLHFACRFGNINNNYKEYSGAQILERCFSHRNVAAEATCQIAVCAP